MSETATLEFIARRLDGLQNNVSGLNRRMITLESNLIDRVGALEARMAGLEDRADQLVDRIGALATGVNSLVLLVERIAKAQGLAIETMQSCARRLSRGLPAGCRPITPRPLWRFSSRLASLLQISRNMHQRMP